MHVWFKTFKILENANKCELAVNWCYIFIVFTADCYIQKWQRTIFLNFRHKSYVFMLFVEIILKLFNTTLQSKQEKCIINEFLKRGGQFSNQLFSKWHKKTLANEGERRNLKENPLLHHHIFHKTSHRT